MIRVEKNAEGLVVRFPYNPDHIAKIKTIRGYRWHPEGKYWSLPQDEGILEKVVSIFDGEGVDIEPNVYFEALRKVLASRKYSRRTMKLYMHYNGDFLRFAKKAPHEVSNSDVRDYLYYLAMKKNASASTLNIALNALKFYYGVVLKQMFAYEIKRPKKDRKLPVVLSQGEITKLLSSVKNLKHEAILMLTYFEDIDPKRKIFHIRGS
jgi:hypothetical protein